MDSHRSSRRRRGNRSGDAERAGSGRFVERFIGFGRVAHGGNDFVFNTNGFDFNIDGLGVNTDGFSFCDLFFFFEFVCVIQPAASIKSANSNQSDAPVKSAPSVPASSWKGLSDPQASWPKLPLLRRHRDPCRIPFLSGGPLAPWSGCSLMEDSARPNVCFLAAGWFV